MYMIDFVFQSSTDRHLGYVHLLATVNNAAMNMDAQISVHVSVFNSFRYIIGSGITESHGNSMFNFLRDHHTVFHSGCTILHFHQQCTRVLISPHPCNSCYFQFGGFFFYYNNQPNGCEVVCPFFKVIFLEVFL